MCGATSHEALRECQDQQTAPNNLDVFTEFALDNQRGVGWQCRQCLKYSTSEFRDFAYESDMPKLSWGLYFDEQKVHDRSDSLSAMTALKEALHDAIQSGTRSKSELEQVLQDENYGAQVRFHLRNETDADSHYHIYYDPAEMQNNMPLPLNLTRSFREFGNDPPVPPDAGCNLIGAAAEDDDDCGVPYNDVDTQLALSASLQLQLSLLGGCRAQEQDTQVHKEACTPYISQDNTRYNRLKAFQSEVLSKAFGLRSLSSPPMASQHGSTSATLIGCVAFFRTMPSTAARRARKAASISITCCTTRRAARKCTATRCWKTPCFEDHNSTVHLLNPWLGGNYSFIKYFVSSILTPEDKYQDNIEKLLQPGLDTCTLQQTVAGENLQPCQGYMCIPFQSMAGIHPDDVNRTVCRFSEELSPAYKRYELLEPIELEKLTRLDNREELYRIPDTPTLCDAEYSTVGPKARECRHQQATLGFSPAKQRGRATPAPSLNRSSTDAAQRVDAHIARDVYRVGRQSLARLLWAGAFHDAEQHGNKKYVALAVAPEQISPARVRVKVADSGALVVEQVALLQTGEEPGVAWVGRVHLGVDVDQRAVLANGLYAEKRDAPGHWACPLLVREALTGVRFPALHVLQPDPSQAKAAFPDLLGAHPALRTQPVLPAQLARYRMLGLHRVVHETSKNSAFTREDARARARLLRHNATKLDVETASSPAQACLRWPNVHPQEATCARARPFPGRRRVPATSRAIYRGHLPSTRCCA